MEKQGYIKLHRKIIDWEWYDDINTKTLFIHILLMVNFEDKKWRGELVKRGSFITSYQSLATQTGLTVQQVRTSLKKLITTNDVTKVTSNKNTVIIVPNYNLYQSLQQADEHTNNNEVTIKQQTNNKQVTTTKNEKNEKNKKNDKNVNKTYIGVIQSYTDDKALIEALKSYVDMRQKTKGFTTRALELNLNALNKLTNDIPTKIEIVNQSISNTWKSFYPLKNQKQAIVQEWNYEEEPEMSEEELKEMIANIKSRNRDIKEK